ncbi:phosphotransferase family protein [Novosphingobium sp. HII-3]|uniref:phosphotransferase family protein n=1 Tax=Novosphingobium sp. HII-3 TaxID=2075565 RepID=UPI001304AE90|nr:phosphotransferase family protein [Novosphingobium sp. HII-3]
MSNSDQEMIAAVMTATKPNFKDIDPTRIRDFLSGQPDVSAPVEIENVRGGGANAGASSGVVVFDARIGGDCDTFVLRYAPMQNEGRIFFDYGMSDQFELQRRLSTAGMAVPKGLWVDPDGAALGLPGFIMEKVEGDVAHASPFSAGLIGDAEPDVRKRRIRSIFSALADVHKADWRAMDLEPFTKRGAGRTHFERYLNWYWTTVEWVRPAQQSRLDSVRRWLFANQPSHHVDDLTLIHGDPSLGNYMINGEEVSAVIDWELAGIVSPSYDIAMQLMANEYYRAVSSPEVSARIPDSGAWLADYEAVAGRKLSDLEFYKRAVAFTLLTVQLSMARNVPADGMKAYLDGLETVWAIAEGA